MIAGHWAEPRPRRSCWARRCSVRWPGATERTTAELPWFNNTQHRLPQTQQGMRAIGRSRGGAARQLRHLSAPAADLDHDGGTASQVLATAELLGTTRLGITDCRPFKGRVLWWSRGSYVPEQAPQGATGRGLGWSQGPHGPEEQHDFGGGSRGWNRD